MKTRSCLLVVLLLFSVQPAFGQQISEADLVRLTPEWQGERSSDGRPRVPDELLARMKLVTLEEAWAVLKGENFTNQYEEGWVMINPDSVLVGRAVTATFMPGRPDVHRVIDEKGHNEDGRIKSQNAWPIDLLVKGDVYVADQFGAHEDGPHHRRQPGQRHPRQKRQRCRLQRRPPRHQRAERDRLVYLLFPQLPPLPPPEQPRRCSQYDPDRHQHTHPYRKGYGDARRRGIGPRRRRDLHPARI